MTVDQLTEQMLKHNGKIAGIEEKLASAHKRIDENDRVIEGIYELAANIKSLATEVKLLAERMDESIERIENGLKSQGERIGSLEKEPAHKWKTLIAQIISLATAAIVGGIIAFVFK